ncbi:Fur family transcriptional regulator [Paraglaciecola arctica]|uniref:Fur family transcriptional regulator n=1 Tax=Paraglaciecola arctica TaxID=1128911 RepID=UPI0020905D3C|nr:transcriptional repressor [Paraglaciecola arctica]
MMSTVAAKDMVKVARNICDKTGNRLTETRQHVLEVLFELDTPVSAYELTEHYNLLIDSPIKTMSIYRILDFLESIRLVHRLRSINKYIVCHHSVGACHHKTPFFLVCKSCHCIKDLEIATEFVTAFLQQVEEAGFLSVGSQMELSSLCKNCQQSLEPNSPGDIHD